MAGATHGRGATGRRPGGRYGLNVVWNTEPCAGWPGTSAQDQYAGRWNRSTASTLLLIGNTGDPATPYQSSVAMSPDLARVRLLTVRGFGHTEFFNPSTCATEDEVSYLTTGTLPPAGTVCPRGATPVPRPVQLSYPSIPPPGPSGPGWRGCPVLLPGCAEPRWVPRRRPREPQRMPARSCAARCLGVALVGSRLVP